MLSLICKASQFIFLKGMLPKPCAGCSTQEILLFSFKFQALPCHTAFFSTKKKQPFAEPLLRDENSLKAEVHKYLLSCLLHVQKHRMQNRIFVYKRISSIKTSEGTHVFCWSSLLCIKKSSPFFCEILLHIALVTVDLVYLHATFVHAQ